MGSLLRRAWIGWIFAEPAYPKSLGAAAKTSARSWGFKRFTAILDARLRVVRVMSRLGIVYHSLETFLVFAKLYKGIQEDLGLL